MRLCDELTAIFRALHDAETEVPALLRGFVGCEATKSPPKLGLSFGVQNGVGRSECCVSIGPREFIRGLGGSPGRLELPGVDLT